MNNVRHFVEKLLNFFFLLFLNFPIEMPMLKKPFSKSILIKYKLIKCSCQIIWSLLFFLTNYIKQVFSHCYLFSLSPQIKKLKRIINHSYPHPTSLSSNKIPPFLSSFGKQTKYPIFSKWITSKVYLINIKWGISIITFFRF